MINLKNPYNREEFIQLLKSFLPDFKEEKENIQIDRRFKYIKSINKVGISKSLDIKIYEIEHESEYDPRVSLSREAFLLLKIFSVHKALIAFKNKKSSNYRLSLVTYESKWETGTKIRTEFSHPKRLSFFLGPNAKINTPYNFLVNRGTVANFEDLKNRFSLEVVNKLFYQEIAKLYTKLVGGTISEGGNLEKYPGLLDLPSLTRGGQIHHEFAVRLIGRIIFCWFLREKKSKDNLSLVPEDVLSSESAKANENYYHNVLEPLFFEILNKHPKSRLNIYNKPPFIHVPYLNGGLFTPQVWDFYDERHKFTLKVPDIWLLELLKVLELYNFTVDENTSVDVDLSIDPEMLGRIFENLLAEINPDTGESARKNTGSYYTPRTIVEYMIDESIYQYLKEKTLIDDDKLRALSSYDVNDDEEHPLSQIEKEKIIDALSKITILDPACGSGAFPIGALQKIVFMLQMVDPDAKMWFQKQIISTTPEVKKLIEHEFVHKNFDYIRKLGVIRKSIFGVDIQPIATEISRLRCFLTLVVEETIDDSEVNRGIEPLPNLDFKFVTANSLVGFPKEKQAISQQNLLGNDEEDEIKELRNVMEDYFNSRNHEREECKKRFYLIRDKLLKRTTNNNSWNNRTKYLATWDPFSHEAALWFDPEWMFGLKDGFDIVIANPPYIVLSPNDFPNYEWTRGNNNTYVAFIERAYNLINDYGIVVYIVPSTWLSGNNFEKMRNDLIAKERINQIVQLPYDMFEAAYVDNVILLTRGDKAKNETVRTFKFNIKETLNAIKIHFDEFRPKEDWSITPGNVIFLNKSLLNILKKYLKLKSVVLGEIASIQRGTLPPKENEYVGPDINNKNIIQWFTGQVYRYVVTKGLIKYVKYDQLRENKPINLFLCPKIFGRQLISRQFRLQFAYTDQEFAFKKNLYAIYNLSSRFDYFYVLTFLNSRLFSYIQVNLNASGQRDDYPSFSLQDYKNFMIPLVDQNEQTQYVLLAKKIMEITKDVDYQKDSKKQSQVAEFENRIDQLVYKLYDLKPEEIQIIEAGSNGKQ